jgi:hypothetical protein
MDTTDRAAVLMSDCRFKKMTIPAVENHYGRGDGLRQSHVGGNLFAMENMNHIIELHFPYSRLQMDRFRSGDLMSDWTLHYPGLFDDDDLRLHKSQPQFHFYEFLAAVMFRETLGYNSLIEKYETALHEKKIVQFREIAGQAVYEDVLANRTGVPDLFVFAADHSDWFFCEVKGANDQLRAHQIERFEELYQVSKKPVYVLYLAER